MATPLNNFETALDARDKGIAAIPIYPATKVPMVKWKGYQQELPSVELLEEWFKDTKNNIAIVTQGMVVFDCETPEKANLVIAHCGDTSHKLRSAGGGLHLGYRKRKGVELKNQVKIKGLPIDIRTDGGIEMVPYSVTKKGKYEWLGDGLKPVAELPVATIGWTRTRARKCVLPTPVLEFTDTRSLLYRGMRYVDTFPEAISGNGGHRTCFIASLKIVRFVRRLGGDDNDALRILVYYNSAKCRPEWDEPALKHKWIDALKLAR